MLRFFLLLFICCFAVITAETSTSLEELKDDFMDTFIKCAEQVPLTDDEIKAIQSKVLPDNPNIRCFFACALKKTGMMDERGYLSLEGVRNISQRYISEDPDILTTSDQFTDACKSVNNVPVSDGDKGCERAALIYKCTMEKAPQFDLIA